MTTKRREHNDRIRGLEARQLDYDQKSLDLQDSQKVKSESQNLTEIVQTQNCVTIFIFVIVFCKSFYVFVVMKPMMPLNVNLNTLACKPEETC